MARPEKVAVVDEVKESLTGAAATILTEYRGLSVGELAALRAELRKANASYKIAKNTLVRRAAAEAEMDIEQLLAGPTALVFCDEDPVGPAKALKAFAKDHPELVVKGSWLDGELLDGEATIKLADLESREDLLARLAGLMHGALANTARLLNAAPAKMAQLLAALESDGGPEAKGATAPAAAPAADEDAAEASEPAQAEAADEPAQAEAADEPAQAEEPAAEVAQAPAEPTESGDDGEGGVLDAVTDAVATVTEAATEVAETAVETAAEVAETVAGAAEAAAEAIDPDAEASDGDDQGSGDTDEQTEQA